MKKENKHIFRSPKSLENLDLKINNEINGEVIDGVFYNKNGESYIIKDGIIDFTVKEEIKGIAKIARDQYKIQSKTYDKNVDITFELYNEKSEETRNFMVNLLNLSPENDVLEISSGTGLDSEIIISQLSEEGSFTSIDISPDMVKIAYNRLKNSKINKNITVGNACSLPFNDNSFDIVFCNHVLEHIQDDTKAMKELYRVMKKGGMGVFQIPQDLNRESTFEDNSITDRKERAKIFGQYDHVRIYGRDYFDTLRSVGFKVDEVDYTATLSDQEIDRYRLAKGEIIPVVYKPI